MMNFINACGPYVMLAATALVAALFVSLWFKSESLRKSGSIMIQQWVTFTIPIFGAILVIAGFSLFLLTDDTVIPGVAVLIFSGFLLLPEFIRIFGPTAKSWLVNRRVTPSADSELTTVELPESRVKLKKLEPELPKAIQSESSNSIKFTDLTPRPVKPTELNLLVELSREMKNMRETIAAQQDSINLKRQTIVRDRANSQRPSPDVQPGQHEAPWAAREAPKRRKLNVST